MRDLDCVLPCDLHDSGVLFQNSLKLDLESLPASTVFHNLVLTELEHHILRQAFRHTLSRSFLRLSSIFTSCQLLLSCSFPPLLPTLRGLQSSLPNTFRDLLDSIRRRRQLLRSVLLDCLHTQLLPILLSTLSGFPLLSS